MSRDLLLVQNGHRLDGGTAGTPAECSLPSLRKDPRFRGGDFHALLIRRRIVRHLHSLEDAKASALLVLLLGKCAPVDASRSIEEGSLLALVVPYRLLLLLLLWYSLPHGPNPPAASISSHGSAAVLVNRVVVAVVAVDVVAPDDE